MEADVGEPRVALCVDGDAVRQEELAAPPRAEGQPRLGVQHYHHVVVQGRRVLVVMRRVEAPKRTHILFNLKMCLVFESILRKIMRAILLMVIVEIVTILILIIVLRIIQ